MKQAIISILLISFICAALSAPAEQSEKSNKSRKSSKYSLNKTDIDKNWGYYKGNYTKKYNNNEDSNR